MTEGVTVAAAVFVDLAAVDFGSAKLVAADTDSREAPRPASESWIDLPRMDPVLVKAGDEMSNVLPGTPSNVVTLEREAGSCLCLTYARAA